MARAEAPVNYALQANDGLGDAVFDWSDYSSLQNNAGTASLEALSGMPDGATKALKLTRNATASFGQCVPSPAFALGAHLTSIAMWVNNPSGRTLDVELKIYNVGAARQWNVTYGIAPTDGWRLLVVPKLNMTGGTFTLASDTAGFVRVTQSAAAFAWAAGDVCYFGPVYVNTRSRPKFLLCTDDGRVGNITDGASFPTGYPASGGNFLDILTAYGFKGTAYVIPGLIGVASYMTWAQVNTLAAAGWSIASHSGEISPEDWEDADNRGLANLGPVGFAASVVGATNDDLTIEARVRADCNAVRSRGYSAWQHYALSQGGWDEYVRTGIQRTEVLTVRGVSGHDDGHRIPLGAHSGSGNFNGTDLPSVTTGWIDLPSCVSMEAVWTDAQLKAYVNEVIRTGATGGAYVHIATAASCTQVDMLCAYLAIKQAQGLVDVVTVEDWYAGLSGARASSGTRVAVASRAAVSSRVAV